MGYQFRLDEFLQEGGTKKLRNYSLGNSYASIGWVFTPVRVLANTISGVPLSFFDEKNKLITKKTHEDHPLYVAITPPKRYEHSSIRDLINTSVTLQSLLGDVFWYKEKVNNKLTNIVLKKGDRIQALVADKTDKDSELRGWAEVDASGNVIKKYLLDELLQFKYPNPYDRWRGLAPLRAARLGVEQAFNIEAWNAAYFATGARNPFAIINTRGQFKPSQKEDLGRQIQKYFSGIEGGQSALLLDSNLDIKVLKELQKDIDFVVGKQLIIEELCAIFGVMPAMAGVYRYSNYANSAQQRQIFWETTGISLLETYKDNIQQNFLDVDFPGCSCRWALEKITAIRPNELERAKTIQIYYLMGYDRQEIGTILADETLLNLKNVGGKKEETSNTTTTVTEGEKDDSENSDDSDVSDSTNLFGSGLKKKTFLEKYSANYLKNIITPLETVLKGIYDAYTDEMGNYAISFFKKYKSYNLDINFFRNTWDNSVKDFFEKVILGGAISVYLDIYGKNKNEKFYYKAKDLMEYEDVLEDYQVEFLTDFTANFISITSTIPTFLATSLKDEIQRGLMEGYSVDEINKIIKEKVADISSAKSLMISRTLTGGAYNGSRYLMYMNMGVISHKWVNAGDNLVRNPHVMENGHIVRIGEAFPITRLLYPCQIGGSPSQIVNCRCTTFPISVRSDTGNIEIPEYEIVDETIEF
jgi:HK97 family phage portal protein